MDTLKLTKKISADRQKVFESFTKPRILENWAAPDGMTLKIPDFEGKTGGRYRFEHTSDKGVYICTGYFKEFVLNEKLVQIETVRDPVGKIILDNLKSVTEFKSVGNETEVQIIQSGFENEESSKECEQGWVQSFVKLERLFSNEGDEYQSHAV